MIKTSLSRAMKKLLELLNINNAILFRAVNARTKSHAAEISAKQARVDSDYARLKAREVAPDFVQPGSFCFRFLPSIKPLYLLIIYI